MPWAHALCNNTQKARVDGHTYQTLYWTHTYTHIHNYTHTHTRTHLMNHRQTASSSPLHLAPPRTPWVREDRWSPRPWLAPFWLPLRPSPFPSGLSCTLLRLCSVFMNCCVSVSAARVFLDQIPKSCLLDVILLQKAIRNLISPPLGPFIHSYVHSYLSSGFSQPLLPIIGSCCLEDS